MSLFNQFFAKFLHTMEMRAAHRVYRELQHFDSDVRDRAGICPKLFAHGPAAYPWRDVSSAEQASAQTNTSASITQLHNGDEAAIRQTIAELRACSDAELAAIGIVRSDIVDAVSHGIPEIDRSFFTPSHQTAA